MSNPFNESDEQAKARRGRSLAIALGLVIFVVLIFVVSFVNMGGAIANRPL
jgi:flagellar basal body-associated protein FliL